MPKPVRGKTETCMNSGHSEPSRPRTTSPIRSITCHRASPRKASCSSPAGRGSRLAGVNVLILSPVTRLGSASRPTIRRRSTSLPKCRCGTARGDGVMPWRHPDGDLPRQGHRYRTSRCQARCAGHAPDQVHADSAGCSPLRRRMFSWLGSIAAASARMPV